MNELELLERLREEIPLNEISPAVESAVLAAIRDPARSARHSRSRQLAGHSAARLAWALRQRGRRRGLRVALAGTLALAAGAAGAGLAASMAPAQPPLTPSSGPPIPWSGRPTATWSGSGYPSFGEARTGAQLIEYATRAAAVAPGRAPRADEWIFTKVEFADSSGGGGGYLFGPPDRRLIGLGWTRVDRLEYAAGGDYPASLPPSQVVHGKLQIVPDGGGCMSGWKSCDYSYLNSLPTDPARLESVILAENASPSASPAMPDNVTVFNAIYLLLFGQTEGMVWIPPKLAATMYQLLLRLPGVHFEAGTDLAGRSGIGIYMVLEGWYKQELVINPVTYMYMGDKAVAVQAHVFSGTDGVRHVEKGHVLGWQALLEEAIVQRPGQFP